MNENKLYIENLCRYALDNGGEIYPLIVPSNLTKGSGLMNPSVFVDNGKVLVNIRHVNYLLYHSEGKKFQHRFGPLQYLHPENDMHLRTTNFLAKLNPDTYQITNIDKVDTSTLDQNPIWDFIGLEDARLVRWNGKLYLSGVRRDTTPNGQGRIELSELSEANIIRELSRQRIPAPGDNNSYCEKNWMPIIDKPFTYIKWANPTDIVTYHPDTKTVTNSVKNNYIPNVSDFRGGSQVIPYKNKYIAIIHDVNLFNSIAGRKDAVYRHRFITWDKNFDNFSYTHSFSFMKGDIEFSCGMAIHKESLLISFGFQDNAAFLLKMPLALLDELLTKEIFYKD